MQPIASIRHKIGDIIVVSLCEADHKANNGQTHDHPARASSECRSCGVFLDVELFKLELSANRTAVVSELAIYR